MSYQERKTIVSILSGVLVLAAYCIYAFGRVQSGAADASDLKFWAGTILVFIGIGVVAIIVIQIVFHILMSIAIAVKETVRDELAGVRTNDKTIDAEIEKSIKTEMVEDEMDKLIELKSMRVGFGFAGVGFVAGLISLVLGYPTEVMLNVVFLSFSGGSILEGATQLYFYRRGISHG